MGPTDSALKIDVPLPFDDSEAGAGKRTPNTTTNFYQGQERVDARKPTWLSSQHTARRGKFRTPRSMIHRTRTLASSRQISSRTGALSTTRKLEAGKSTAGSLGGRGFAFGLPANHRPASHGFHTKGRTPFQGLRKAGTTCPDLRVRSGEAKLRPR